ncbi:MAG: methylated-DNA--[protein]-cysteine S-methyltransferase [Acidimicrobiales bacterium]
MAPLPPPGWVSVAAPPGDLWLAGGDAGLAAVCFGGPSLAFARALGPGSEAAGAHAERARRQLEEYFDGRRRRFDLDLDWSLTRSPFRRAVLEALAEVPFGVTVSYGELARRVGNPGAVRAVGTAMATNPLPLVVPCHRVLRAGGALGGYAGGLDLKRWLLAHEGASLL